MNLIGGLSLPGPNSIPGYWPILVAVVVAAIVGARRGWVRELTSLGGILAAWLVVGAFGLSVIELTNRVTLIARFTFGGGFDLEDPGHLLRALRLTPTIDPWTPDTFLLSVFAIGVVGSYALGSRLAAERDSAIDSVFGVFAGGLNGYLVAYVAAGFVGSAGAGGLDLGKYVAVIAVVAVVAAVVIAVVATMRGASLRSRRAELGGDG